MNENFLKESMKESILEKVILERFKYSIQHYVPEEYMMDSSHFQIASYVDKVTRNMVITVSAHVFGQRLDEVVMQSPANWKEAIKERFAPKWFLKMWPVKYREFRLEPRVLYPQIKMPDEKHYITFGRIVDK